MNLNCQVALLDEQALSTTFDNISIDCERNLKTVTLSLRESPIPYRLFSRPVLSRVDGVPISDE